MKFKFYYDSENDVLSIYRKDLPVYETVEFLENLNLDVDKKEHVVGLEIFDASNFFGKMNKEINKGFLISLEGIQLEQRDIRNLWYILVLLKSKGKEVVQQPLPLLRKSEYKSPLLASVS